MFESKIRNSWDNFSLKNVKKLNLSFLKNFLKFATRDGNFKF